MEKTRVLLSNAFSLCAFILLSVTPVNALEINIHNAFSEYQFQQELPVMLEVEGQELTAAEAFSRNEYNIEQYASSLQPGPETWWYRIEINGSFDSRQPRQLYLSLDNYIVTHFDLYLFRDGQLTQTRKLGIADRTFENEKPYRGQTFQFAVSSGEKLTLLIRKQSVSPAIMPLWLFSESQFEQVATQRYLFWGAAIALVLVVAIYNGIIYLMVRNRAYAWYLAFYLVTFFYFSGLHGFGFLLWGETLQRWLAQHIMTLNFLLLWLTLQFATVFLLAKKNAPAYYRIVKQYHWVLLAGFITSFVVVEYTLIPIFGLLQAVVSVFAMMMAVTAWRNNFYPARFFILSWMMVLIGAAVGMLTFTNILPANFITLHGFFFGAVCELLLLSVGLADRLRYYEKKSMAQAFTDPQSGLPNYSYFQSEYFHYQQEANTAVAKDAPLLVFLIQLSGFRSLLGLLGPRALENALSSHIRVFTQHLESKNWALDFQLPDGRLSKIIVLPADRLLIVGRQSGEVADMVTSLLALAEQPVEIENMESKLELNIGVSPFEPTKMHAYDAYRHAQIALVHCDNYKNSWRMYSEEQDAMVRQKLSLLSDLRKAIEAEELDIYIQPQFAIASERLTGGEVLVRWRHSKRGMVSPGEFIPLAEESNLIFGISQLVITKACQWLHSTQVKAQEFHLSINLSVLDLEQPGLLTFIQEQLDHYQVNPNQIVFEVTESAAMHDQKRFLSVIDSLHQMGVMVALDDFGTGYSSMQYMQTIDADVVKIDMSFIRDIDRMPINQKIVHAIIQMAHSTNAETVAEGIETRAEMATLERLGANKVQGFLMGKPLPREEFEQTFFNQFAD